MRHLQDSAPNILRCYVGAEDRLMQTQASGCSLLAGVTPSLAVFLLLLVGALLGAAAGAAAVWWHNRRQLRYLQPQSPQQASYAASLQVLPPALVALLAMASSRTLRS